MPKLAAEEAARLLDAQGQTSPGEDQGVFWSGGEHAKEIAKGAGDSLESKGTAGYLFDNLEFGLGWGKMGALWDAVSAHLANGCKGVVQAHQYRGVRKTSVFARVELPVLKKALDDDIVEKIEFGPNGMRLLKSIEVGTWPTETEGPHGLDSNGNPVTAVGTGFCDITTQDPLATCN